MREFVYYSKNARTSGNWKDNDLMKAGRMDIVCNFIIQALFISNQVREDVHIHLIFDGMPCPPRHLEIVYDEGLPISKKDIAGLIKRMLYKCKSGEGKKVKVFPGCFIEKKSLPGLLKELADAGKRIFILDRRGKSIQEFDDNGFNNCVFVIGDQEGLPVKELKKYKDRISLGKKIYFASQTAIILNYEIDLRNDFINDRD